MIGRFFAIVVSFMLAGGGFANPIPAELPAPDTAPPSNDKPVKVYILSGQSNMVGFGRLEGGSPAYPSVYLSADPSVVPSRMPVGSSGLLPHGVYQSADAGAAAGAKVAIYPGAYDSTVDYSKQKPVKEATVALGTVDATLPAVDGPHTVVVNAFIEVPLAGMHEVHVGFGDSAQAIAVLDGIEVYRKLGDEDEVLKKVKLEPRKRYPLTITYLKGGSAAFWMQLVDLTAKGNLKYLVEEQGKFKCLTDGKGGWSVRNDVILCESYLDKNKFKGGRSTALNAKANGSFIGPELGFGYVMGTFHDEPVLIIKSDIGNRSLAWDCLPPGSKRYEVDGMVYAGYKDPAASWPKGTEPKKGGWYAGKQYDDYTAAIRGVLDNFDTLYPQYKDQGYEIAGFVWWQGHKDQNPVHASKYEENLTNLIKAWRTEFKAPEAKWVIATIAFGGWTLGEPGKTIAEAQLAVSGDSGKHPEFKGNVKTVEARGFWRGRSESPTGTGYHYNHNAETYFLTGDALGRAMVGLLGGTAEPRPGASRPPASKDHYPENLTLEQMGQLIYEDAFISSYATHDREPTAEHYAQMTTALKPLVFGKLIPEYVAEAPKVPRYRRHGMSLKDILNGDRPKGNEYSINLRSQLDLLNSYYNAVGVHDYDWKPFGPDMKTATWSYYSFDPPEKQDLSKGGRNRTITLPEGMTNWVAVDFDPAAAGWKTGAAPFGQNDGKLVPLRETCRSNQCGCATKPNTLWEKEVLLMRQTFELPELDENKRYRLVLGGSAHPFSGEGFSIYVNGKLFAESTSGQYKGKGGARGSYIFNDFLPEFKSGKVTIAVKGFLRYTRHKNKLAPPTGHLSVWMESMALSPPLKRLTKK